MAAELNPDDWELVNDDGFVYKRKKRRLDPSAVARPADPAPDPALLAKHRRERKRSALLKVKAKYSKEISLWEHLAESLRAMEERATDKRVGDDAETQTLGVDPALPEEGASVGNLFLDELLLQVEGQESIIHHITNLCDAAEALCDAHEDNMKQSLLDLPVWESPRQLMASFSEV